MGFKDLIAFVKKLWIPLFLFLLIIPNKLLAQPATLELHRIWAIDLDQDVTALRLADLDGEGTNEIFVGLWDGDSGYIEVFSGLNGIFIQTSEKIPAHKIIDLDVGDIDGDQDLDLVVGADSTDFNDNSLICVLEIQKLSLDWQVRIGEEVKSVEVQDIGNDDTAEIFIGTSLYTSETLVDEPWCYESRFQQRGSLYRLNGPDSIVSCIDDSFRTWFTYWKIIAEDVNQDSLVDIVCGTYYSSYTTGYAHGGLSWEYWSELARIEIMDRETPLHWLTTLFFTGDMRSYWWHPSIISISIGNCDSSDDKEIVSCIRTAQNLGGTPNLLLVSDPSGDSIENSTPYAGDPVALELFDINAEPPQEILIAHSNGIIEAVNGTTFDTVAISDPLPPISFFAFGDVTEDAMPEICISDGDSLFLYGFGPTSVEEEDEENLVSQFVLHQNYPNPFNPQTTIKYHLPRSSKVVLNIYNIMGQKIKTLVNDLQFTGFQSVTWDGTDKNDREVASGVYFYRVKTDYSQETKKMVLLK
jgi:hypothetical protein